MRYERQLVLREWGSAGQAVLAASHASLPCAGSAFAVAERYLRAAGVPSVEASATRAGAAPPEGPFASALGALPWHAEGAREIGIGAAHAVDFLAAALHAVPR